MNAIISLLIVTQVGGISDTARDPGLALSSLRGLNPAHYLAKRVPEPEVTRELSQLNLPVSVMTEVYESGWTAFISEPEAFSPRMQPAQIDNYRRLEGMALRRALLLAIGKSGEITAPVFLARVLWSHSSPPELRTIAAVALGQTRAPTAGPVLKDIALGGDDIGLSVAALRGAAHLRNDSGLAILVAATAADKPAELRRAAVSNLGLFGSQWAWPQGEAGEGLRRGAVDTLVELVAEPGTSELEPALLEALATAYHHSTRESLEALVLRRPAVKNRVTRALQRIELVEQRVP